MAEVTVERFADGVFIASRPLDEGVDVRAALVLGAARAVVIDTLARPADMAPFVALIARSGLPCTVVDTHADWDHAWGNCAFPDAPIAGHVLCAARLRSQVARDELARKRGERPGFFDDVTLVPPSITFETQMTIDAGGVHVDLHHTPGHTSDSIVAYVRERRLLFAGDCVEDPLPLLESGPLDGWAAALRAWTLRDVAAVIPAHGAIAGSDLLASNAAYLESLLDEHAAPPRTDVQFYVAAHLRNVSAARSLARGVRKAP